MQIRSMKRREFITLARRHGGGVAVVGTRAAGGNAGDRNLCSGSSSAFAELLGPFRQGLNETGWLLKRPAGARSSLRTATAVGSRRVKRAERPLRAEATATMRRAVQRTSRAKRKRCLAPRFHHSSAPFGTGSLASAQQPGSFRNPCLPSPSLSEGDAGGEYRPRSIARSPCEDYRATYDTPAEGPRAPPEGGRRPSGAAGRLRAAS